jgi:hypothetical protein
LTQRFSEVGAEVRRGSEPRVIEGKPGDAIAEMNDVEVEQEADGQPRELQVRQELRPVNGQDAFRRLYFHHHGPIDHEIHPIARIEVEVLEPKRCGYLPLNVVATLDEQVFEARLVGGLQKTWPEGSVDNERSVQDGVRPGGSSGTFSSCTLPTSADEQADDYPPPISSANLGGAKAGGRAGWAWVWGCRSAGEASNPRGAGR